MLDPTLYRTGPPKASGDFQLIFFSRKPMMRNLLEFIEVPKIENIQQGLPKKNIKDRCLVTPPETNIVPENWPSLKETSIPTIHFQGLCWFQGVYDFSGHYF